MNDQDIKILRTAGDGQLKSVTIKLDNGDVLHFNDPLTLIIWKDILKLAAEKAENMLR
jgi:hypothetical protein